MARVLVNAARVEISRQISILNNERDSIQVALRSPSVLGDTDSLKLKRLDRLNREISMFHNMVDQIYSSPFDR